jgi:pimeloyl-ACP methyl ester carboxylesterase
MANASSSRTARPPRLIYSLLEGRALLEAALLPALLPVLSGTPRGDGHPVLLVPGFTAGDATMVGLKMFLRSRGYHVETWGFGQNTGFKLKFSQALEQKVRFLHHKHRRKVSIVGWSLGGVYGFYTAHSAPECVRTVISLGSPMQFSPDKFETPLLVRRFTATFAHPMGPVAHLAHVRAKVLRVAPADAVDLHLLDDRRRRAATGGPRRLRRRQHENVWVPGSHIGLGFNAAVMWILADRLAQAEGRLAAVRASTGASARSTRPGRTSSHRPPERGAADRPQAALRRAGLPHACASCRPWPSSASRLAAPLRLAASSRYSWNDSRMHSAKNSGSGICSRHDVGEMKILPS